MYIELERFGEIMQIPVRICCT